MSLTIQQTQAIYKLYPQTLNIIGNVAYDAEDNIVEYDPAAVQAEAEATEAAKLATQNSALAKLKKLGLTDDEISALKGTL